MLNIPLNADVNYKGNVYKYCGYATPDGITMAILCKDGQHILAPSSDLTYFKVGDLVIHPEFIPVSVITSINYDGTYNIKYEVPHSSHDFGLRKGLGILVLKPIPNFKFKVGDSVMYNGKMDIIQARGKMSGLPRYRLQSNYNEKTGGFYCTHEDELSIPRKFKVGDFFSISSSVYRVTGVDEKNKAYNLKTLYGTDTVRYFENENNYEPIPNAFGLEK